MRADGGPPPRPGGDRRSIRDLAQLGLTPTTRNVRRYGESQRTVYHIAGRAVGDFLEATGRVELVDGDVAVLGDAMALMRYADDMIDLYGVPESEFVAALNDQTSGLAFYDLTERLGEATAQFHAAIEYLLAASVVQRQCSDAFYPAAKAAEGEAAGDALWAVVARRCDGADRDVIHAFLRRLSAASNLWDALWDLREDDRWRPTVFARIAMAFARAVVSLAGSRAWSPSFALTLARLMHRYYFKHSARHKWAEQSPQTSWLTYRETHP